MDLLDYLRLVRRRWRILLACVLVAGVAAWVLTPAEPADDGVTYQASHLLIRDSSGLTNLSIAQVALFVKTGEVPQRVADRLGFDGEPAVLASRVTLEPDDQVGTLEVTATGTSPEQAVERANAFAEETLGLLGEQASEARQDQIERVNETLIRLQAEIDDLNRRIADESEPGVLQAERDSKLRQYGAALDQQQQVLDLPPPSAGYVTLEPALVELASVTGGGFAAPSSRPARTAIALVLGALLGLALVLLVERLDSRLHDPEEVARAHGLPVIAEVPREAKPARGRMVVVEDPMSAGAEAFRSLRAALLLSPVVRHRSGALVRPQGGEPRVVLVTSAAPGDGKTTVVANLAAAFAETGRTVLVLGCDFRRPEIQTYFDLAVAPGIADVLTRESAVGLTEIVRATGIENVYLAPSGNRLRSFGDVSAAGRRLLAEAAAVADVVIVDTPPILATNDAAELLPATDAVVVVARVDKTTSTAARKVMDLMDRMDAPTAGVVAVGVPEVTGSYASYYREYAEEAESPASPPPGLRPTRPTVVTPAVADPGEPYAEPTPEPTPVDPAPADTSPAGTSPADGAAADPAPADPDPEDGHPETPIRNGAEPDVGAPPIPGQGELWTPADDASGAEDPDGDPDGDGERRGDEERSVPGTGV